MKKCKIWIILVLAAALISTCGCQKPAGEADQTSGVSDGPTWQEQYDLGVRYLSEGNYQEAIIAFTAAIEIDPKRAPAYVGRGDAYVLSGETEENLTAAQTDYETAVELDETSAEAYLGLADVYIRQGKYETAYGILQEGSKKASNDHRILDKIAEIESGVYSDSQNNVRRSNRYTTDGKLESYTVYEYDFLGRRCGWSNYHRDSQDEDNFVVINYCIVDFDEHNRPRQNQFYGQNGEKTSHDTFEYNEKGLKAVQRRYNADNILEHYFLFFYDDEGKQTKYEGYSGDGTMYNYWVSEYDEQGNRIREVRYSPDGAQEGYTLYS